MIKTERLLSMKERLGKRIKRIAKQGAVGLAKFGYKNNQKIILYTDSGPEVYCPSNGQVFGWEEAGSLPNQNIQSEASSDREEPTIISHSK